MPGDWEENLMVNVFQQEGDVTNCGNYKEITLKNNLLKVLEKILDERL